MYVYIFEDGIVQKHTEPPSDVDFHMIGDGLLTVLKCERVKYIDECGEPCDLEDCGFVVDGSGAYHSPA